jgi:predicted O-linked N-acetylglucosamine transferase (SPINDLY family)
MLRIGQKSGEATPKSDPTPDELEAQANVLLAEGKPGPAAELFQKALQVRPSLPGWNDFSVALYRIGMPRRAAEAAANSMKQGYSTPAMINLANGLINCGEIDASITILWSAWMKNPARWDCFQVLLNALNSSDELSPAGVAAQHMAVASFFPTLRPVRFLERKLPTDRKIRVGYLSPDFRRHSVSYFIRPVLEHHNRDAFEVFCYHTQASDHITDGLLGLADHARKLGNKDSEGLERQVLSDGLDILVELSGHTADNWLETLSRRLAPVQVSWLGYPHTTGVPGIDYKFLDKASALPDDEEPLAFSERVYKLTHAHCWGPGPEAVDVPTDRANPGGPITFGSCSRLSKITPTTFDLWAAVLRAVPGSIFLHKSMSYNDDACMASTVQQFEARGVEPGRVTCVRPGGSHAEHLAWYRELDISLDTIPYQGTTTTFECLYCGVPVVSGRGFAPAARVSDGILASLGDAAGGLVVTDTSEEFIRAAVALADAADWRREWRATGRARLLASPACDGRRQALDVEEAYRRMLEGDAISSPEP